MIVGLDEVGRGCIVGPVIAAAVVLDDRQPIAGLADSKKLSDKKRRLLADAIRLQAKDWAVGRCEASEIDSINIHQASLLAMKRAFMALTLKPDFARVDGKFYPDLPCKGETVVQGDSLFNEISAASILAKVSRDDEMLMLAQLYPGYAFDQHKGYPTRYHLQCLQQQGVTPHYRKTFSPVARLLKESLTNQE